MRTNQLLKRLQGLGRIRRYLRNAKRNDPCLRQCCHRAKDRVMLNAADDHVIPGRNNTPNRLIQRMGTVHGKNGILHFSAKKCGNGFPRRKNHLRSPGSNGMPTTSGISAVIRNCTIYCLPYFRRFGIRGCRIVKVDNSQGASRSLCTS